jgi:lipopolysaccharide export LptBFGC system permease protein LptF
MSDDRGPSEPTDPASPRRRRDIVTTIVMVVFGIILLLPGVCSLFFMSAMGSGSGGPLVVLWVICFVISAGGIALLVKAAT